MNGYWTICYAVPVSHRLWLDHDEAADLDEMLAAAVVMGDWR